MVLPNGSMTSRTDVYGVNFAAILSYASAMGAPVALVAELLPDIEGIVVRSYLSEAET